jgi:hypothetical protein
MKQYIGKFFSFIKSAESEPNGTGSSTRVNLLLLTIGWMLLALPITLMKGLQQYLPMYLGLYASMVAAYITGKAVKDSNTKDSTAQAVPGGPGDKAAN